MNTIKKITPYDLYFCDFVDGMVSDEDAILSDRCHMLFCTLLSRESIQLC